MKSLRRRAAVLGLLGVTSAFMLAGSAFAYSSSYSNVYVPGNGGYNVVPNSTGSATQAPYAYLNTGNASSEPFNYQVDTTSGADLSGWNTTSANNHYAWYVGDQNGDQLEYYVGTGLFYGSGTASGSLSY